MRFLILFLTLLSVAAGFTLQKTDGTTIELSDEPMVIDGISEATGVSTAGIGNPPAALTKSTPKFDKMIRSMQCFWDKDAHVAGVDARSERHSDIETFSNVGTADIGTADTSAEDPHLVWHIVVLLINSLIAI
ncbi:hypothetical protein J4E90_005093 [Alternaria incomplexa]|uniref:uncharacterized protein n=1 Tax=Alternaria incomplexa TaxID=1187928 RepID=UPI00221EAD27|nr:uncharacterized protein J4E90_005093 [Alternaria incomplexa]KAI4915056.1 hypothetical protein J4E90_005093 [Alternaria incomplexa]